MSRFTLLHTFAAPAAAHGPAWPPHVPEARVSPPDDEPTDEDVRETIRFNLVCRSNELRERILATQDARLRQALDDFEYAWEEYQDECL
jgi:hypothetical protein